ncbi:MAG: VanZ family protein [Paraglaciecola sp.]|nr:VanZ family protein [Paraglaciecola sp.]
MNSIRSMAAWFCLFYGLFVVYGSFVPLNFNDLPFEQALSQFLALPFFDFTIVNRSDWFTNYLLFIPLTYALLLIFALNKKRSSVLIALILILVFLLMLSVTIEFVQMFIAARVSSFKDVFAQFLGIKTGYILFYFTHLSFITHFEVFLKGRQQDKWTVYALLVLIIFTLYNLMPLDLSISPVEIYKKWANGKINMIPFNPGRDPILPYLFGVISDLTLWGLITLLYLKSGKYSATTVFFRCVFLSFVVEILQLFVLSRYTDITDVLTAGMGSWLAIYLYLKYGAESLATQNANTPQPIYRFYVIEISRVLWALLLAVFALFPIELIQSKSEFLVKWNGFFSVPFESYWRGSPYSAITQLLRKVLLVLPLGVLISALTYKYQIQKKTAVFFTILTVFYILGLELIQLVLVHKVAVLSDFLLNLTGLYLGFALYKKHINNDEPKNENGGVGWFKCYRLFTSLALVFFSLLIIATFDKTPYNIKELFAEHHFIVSAFLITITLFFALGAPQKLVDVLLSNKSFSIAWLLLAVFSHTFGLFNLIYFSLPLESIYDILGFPVWHNVPSYIESTYRFMGIYLFISAAFFCVASLNVVSHLIVIRAASKLLCIFYAIAILPICFGITVVQAGTDNIIELLPNNGYSFKLLWLVAYLFMVVILSFSWFPRYLPTKKISLVILTCLTMISIPLAYILVESGLQDFIYKYGQGFSALQFLLSPSRDQLLNESALMGIFGLVHLFLMIAIWAVNWALASTGMLDETVSKKSVLIASQ